MPARSARQGPAADHELLGERELHLLPARAPAAAGVAPVGPLDDDPLPVVLQAASGQLHPVPGHALDQAHRFRVGQPHQALQPPPAFRERKRSEILVPVAQHVEDDERGRDVTHRRAHGAARRLQPFLEVLKRQCRARLAGRHDLAVQQHRTPEPEPEGRQRLDDIRELRGLVAAEPRVDARRRSVVQRNQRTNTVVLRLEHEVRTAEDAVVCVGRRRRGQHRSDVTRVSAPCRHRPLLPHLPFRHGAPSAYGTCATKRSAAGAAEGARRPLGRRRARHSAASWNLAARRADILISTVLHERRAQSTEREFAAAPRSPPGPAPRGHTPGTRSRIDGRTSNLEGLPEGEPGDRSGTGFSRNQRDRRDPVQPVARGVSDADPPEKVVRGV